MSYTDLNAQTIDRWIEEGWEWGIPISHEAYAAAQNGEWSMLLTPTKPVPKAWFPPLKGARVLGLAAGGGQQMPLFAACGAVCTVLDYSPQQIESERPSASSSSFLSFRAPKISSPKRSMRFENCIGKVPSSISGSFSEVLYHKVVNRPIYWE